MDWGRSFRQGAARTKTGPSGVASACAALAALFLACARPARPPDIVVVVLDTLRRDATGIEESRHAWQTPMPNLDRLAMESTRYSLAFSTAPWTVPAHASLFTGLQPSSHGCDSDRLRLGPVGETLAELLAPSGYLTAAFYSNPWLADRTTGLLRGFEIRQEAKIGGLETLESPERDQGGAETLRNLESFLANRDRRRPLFLFVNFLEPHLPYNPPPEVRKAHMADLPADESVSIEWGYEFQAGLHDPRQVDWNRVARLYEGDVRYTDLLLGRLLELLRRHDLAEEAVWIVTSDHGENLGENDFFEHQFTLQEAVLAIPLVVRAPRDRLAPGQRNEPVLLTDLFPTILELAGVEPPPRDPHARSLLAGEAERLRPRPLHASTAGPSRGLLTFLQRLNPAFDPQQRASALTSVRVANYRLSSAADGSWMLHDVRTDPLQSRNLVAEKPDLAAQMKRLLLEPGKEDAAATPGGSEIDPETRELLRSLGYIR